MKCPICGREMPSFHPCVHCRDQKPVYRATHIQSPPGGPETVWKIESDNPEEFVQAVLLHEMEEECGHKVAVETKLHPATTLEPASITARILILSEIDAEDVWNLRTDFWKSSSTGWELIRDRIGRQAVEVEEVDGRPLLEFALWIPGSEPLGF